MNKKQDREEVVAQAGIDLMRRIQELTGVDAGDALQLVVSEWMVAFRDQVDKEVWFDAVRSLVAERLGMTQVTRGEMPLPTPEQEAAHKEGVELGVQLMMTFDGRAGETVYVALAMAVAEFWLANEANFSLTEFVGTVRMLMQGQKDNDQASGAVH